MTLGSEFVVQLRMFFGVRLGNLVAIPVSKKLWKGTWKDEGQKG